MGRFGRDLVPAVRALVPRTLFMSAMRTAGDGLPAIAKLAEQCRTSLPATAIRYTRCTRDPVAIVLSTGSRIDYCFMSNALKDLEGINWIRKGEGLSSGTATFAFNQNPEHIRRADRAQGRGCAAETNGLPAGINWGERPPGRAAQARPR